MSCIIINFCFNFDIYETILCPSLPLSFSSQFHINFIFRLDEHHKIQNASAFIVINNKIGDCNSHMWLWRHYTSESAKWASERLKWTKEEKWNTRIYGVCAVQCTLFALIGTNEQEEKQILHYNILFWYNANVWHIKINLWTCSFVCNLIAFYNLMWNDNRMIVPFLYFPTMSYLEYENVRFCWRLFKFRCNCFAFWFCFEFY